jgi:hypothetical protein
MRKWTVVFVGFALVLVTAGVRSQGALGPVPTTLEDFFLPGSQPGESGTLETSDKCDNCHGGYDAAVEPAFNWRGSMMAHALRDPLFFAAVAVAEQDAPGSGDLCIRCHTPKGWIEGRSTPTDGSALQAIDRESVGCDACHRMVRPSRLTVNPHPGDPDYTAGTYPRDQAYLATIDSIPRFFANGMFVLDSDKAKRGPFVDANATHQMYYSPFHREGELCGTCHDVSNPAFDRVGPHEYVPNAFATRAANTDPHGMAPIERTYSEWKASAYNTPQGVYAPQFGGNKANVSTCQDCHMRDVSGVACNKSGAVFRNDQPLHDLTGGNTFMPLLVAAQYPSEVNPAALAAGIARARYMLRNAATLEARWEPAEGGYVVHLRVTNETGHKLPSGYPEGRRMWLRVRAYDGGGALVHESGAYDTTTALLAHDPDLVLYEIEPGISYRLAALLGATPGASFHMVLNDTVYKDNRIPPRGFTNAMFEAIQSPPVAHEYDDGQYWDESEFPVPLATVRVVTELLYQTTSREFVEFLRDENRTDQTGQVMYDLWAAHGKSRPEVMASDTLFLPGPVGVEPAPGSRIALALPRPHPARGTIEVTVTLATGGAAAIELLDVQGRRIERRRIETLGPGVHRIALAAGKQLAPGTYVVRLTQEAASVTRKIVLAR